LHDRTLLYRFLSLTNLYTIHKHYKVTGPFWLNGPISSFSAKKIVVVVLGFFLLLLSAHIIKLGLPEPLYMP
jgi:hypothetical protein